MCRCAEGFECDSDQSRAIKALESKAQVMLDTIAALDFKLNEANELLDMYRTLAIAQEQEIEALINNTDLLNIRLQQIGELFPKK